MLYDHCIRITVSTESAVGWHSCSPWLQNVGDKATNVISPNKRKQCLEKGAD